MKIDDQGDLTFIRRGPGGVEAALHPASGGVVVRDGKDPHGPGLVFTDDQWRALLSLVALGQWPPAHVTWADSGDVAFMTTPGDRSFLRFTAVEMAAFAEGVANGEFALPREPQPAHA